MNTGRLVVRDSGHLRAVLDHAARGKPPPADSTTVLVPSRPGLAIAGVFGFAAHHLVAANVEPEWVAERVAADPFAAMSADFVAALAVRAGGRVGAFDAVLTLRGGGVTAGDAGLVVAHGDHPRLKRARRFRESLDAYVTRNGDGMALLGRGVAGRWEAAFEVEPAARGRGVGRALVGAIAATVPEGEPVFFQCSPGNSASLRAILAAGATPIGSEVLISEGGDE